MTRAFLCDARALGTERAREILGASTELSEFVSVRAEERIAESLAAYLLLSAAMERIGARELPRVIRADGGKPRFDRGCTVGSEVRQIYFSLSHRRGVALLMVSDEGECGADVEECAEVQRIERIERRYLERLDPTLLGSFDCAIDAAVMDEDGSIRFLSQSPEKENYSLHIFKKTTPDSAFMRWTALEAALKVGGGGFADYGRAAEIFGELRACFAEARIGDKTYAIALAR